MKSFEFGDKVKKYGIDLNLGDSIVFNGTFGPTPVNELVGKDLRFYLDENDFIEVKVKHAELTDEGVRIIVGNNPEYGTINAGKKT